MTTTDPTKKYRSWKSYQTVKLLHQLNQKDDLDGIIGILDTDSWESFVKEASVFGINDKNTTKLQLFTFYKDVRDSAPGILTQNHTPPKTQTTNNSNNKVQNQN